MQNVTKEQVLAYIQDEVPFSVQCDGLILQVDQYVPTISTAIHDGHLMSEDLQKICALSSDERLYEEDPHTGEMISSQAIRIIPQFSRYEVDLNRSPQACIYETAWGKNVWINSPSQKMRNRSLKRHRSFYHLLHALVSKLEAMFGSCVIYDVHSYNHLRIDRPTPQFNLGTHFTKSKKWSKDLLEFEKLLKHQCEHPEADVQRNNVFYGKGYFAQFIQEHFDKTLLIPLEIKKNFMDELSGHAYPIAISELKTKLKDTLGEHAKNFALRHTKLKFVRKANLLSSKLEPVILEIDKQLSQLVKGLDILEWVNPINLHQEMSRCFKSGFKREPDFKYKQLPIEPYSFRERLYRLPVHRIQDVDVQRLYQDCIDALASKVDLVTSIGTERFMYQSLICYGEPDLIDLKNAEYILYAADLHDSSERLYNVHEAIAAFEQEISSHGLHFPVQMSKKIVAGAMVDNAKKVILIHPDRKWTQHELYALIHHEFGVHALTTLNAESQPLKLLAHGLPGNTMSQEGLAILSEMLSGNLSIKRLKTLAMRVLATDRMLKRRPFKDVVSELMEQYSIPPAEAFRTTARVFRGGGFTKDHLYLKGFRLAYENWKNQRSLEAMFIGKTSFEYLPLLEELTDRGLLEKPTHIPRAFKEPQHNHEIIEYLVNGIRCPSICMKTAG